MTKDTSLRHGHNKNWSKQNKGTKPTSKQTKFLFGNDI